MTKLRIRGYQSYKDAFSLQHNLVFVEMRRMRTGVTQIASEQTKLWVSWNLSLEIMEMRVILCSKFFNLSGFSLVYIIQKHGLSIHPWCQFSFVT
jgi:hypothetical protein